MKDDISRDTRERVANDILDDIVAGLKQFTFVEVEDPEMEAIKMMKLLDRNFEILDYDRDGISRGELSRALARRTEFSYDEYTMLYLIAKYFDTIAELSDDEPGKQDTRITRIDKDVLGQFLVHSKMNLAQLHAWFEQSERDKPTTPPPLTSQQ